MEIYDFWKGKTFKVVNPPLSPSLNLIISGHKQIVRMQLYTLIQCTVPTDLPKQKIIMKCHEGMLCKLTTSLFLSLCIFHIVFKTEEIVKLAVLECPLC